MAEFRFVFLAASDARLMARVADSPAAWAFEHSSTERVLVRDVLDEVNGVPRHRMLNLLVTCVADALDDDLLNHARALAETTLILLSAVSRAPTGDVDFFVGYETTPNEAGQAFVQWLAAAESPAPRTPTPHELMDQVWGGVQTAAEAESPLAQRVVLSMSLYRRAIRETEVLFRFTSFWLALEALNPRLADYFQVPPEDRQGLSGVRRLLTEVTNDPEVFRTAVKARNDLLHANRVWPDDIRTRVAPLLGRLDDAIVDGWRRLLLIPGAATGPASSVWPYPNRYIIHTRLQPDAEGWSEDRHPWFDQTVTITPRPPVEPGKVTFDESPNWTLHNAKCHTEVKVERRGPETPNPGRIELDEDPAPDPTG